MKGFLIFIRIEVERIQFTNKTGGILYEKNDFCCYVIRSAIIAPLRNVLTLLTITVMASVTTMKPTAVLALLMKMGMVSAIIVLLPIQQLSRTVWADAAAITT